MRSILFWVFFARNNVSYLGRTCAMRQRLTKITHPDPFNNAYMQQESPFVEGQDMVLQEWRRRSETCSCPWEWRKWQKRDTVTSCSTDAEHPAPQEDTTSKAAAVQVPLLRLQHEESIIPWMGRCNGQASTEAPTQGGHIHDP